MKILDFSVKLRAGSRCGDVRHVFDQAETWLQRGLTLSSHMQVCSRSRLASGAHPVLLVLECPWKAITGSLKRADDTGPTVAWSFV